MDERNLEDKMMVLLHTVGVFNRPLLQLMERELHLTLKKNHENYINLK